ncbi:MAG: DNA polymerase IV [Alphaproteobacteria bacterium]|nr:DNA polymerase IV [Alphaproteobacteria bacterium]
MASLCRDCDSREISGIGACETCGSGRIVSHPRLDDLSIAHIDCDAFFAAIEKRDNPELRDKPVLVGGSKRGVVATCCYIARLNGVRSAMPMFKALKLCPEAVVVPPRREAYSEASRQVRDRLQTLTPLVQMISIDEGFLDLSGTERLNHASPALALSRISRIIEEDIGITISIGLSENKYLAKMASEMDKPRGFGILTQADAPAYMAPHPISFLHGVGPQLAKKLERDGLHKVGDLQAMDARELARRYGETGQWLHQRSFGIDHRKVQVETERKSVSAERTFSEDISDPRELEDRLWQVCEETARRAKNHGVEGATLTLKLKTKTFRQLTRSLTLATPTNLAQTMFRHSRPLLEKETRGGLAYRLIGIGLSHLYDARGDTRDLIDPGVEKRAKAERASDLARSKFGKAAVVTGRSVRLDRKSQIKSSD